MFLLKSNTIILIKFMDWPIPIDAGNVEQQNRIRFFDVGPSSFSTGVQQGCIW